MNREKTEALMKWVNSIGVEETITSIEQVFNKRIILEILYLIDNNQETECKTSDGKDVSSDFQIVLAYLEDFYQQSLKTSINETKINSLDILEMGKVLSLLLYCSVQGVNANLFVEKITKFDESTQFAMKSIIEAVLREVEKGEMNIDSIVKILQSSGYMSDCQEYISSPVANAVTSPILFFNSPIRALMASPQMRSRTSQLTISQLYKKLTQLEMTIKTQQHNKLDLEQQLQEKNNLLEDQERRIGVLSKAVAKIPGLEEEIQSLCSVEKELQDVNVEYDRLKKKMNELERYKEKYLKLEREFSVYVTERMEEKAKFEKRMKDAKRGNEEEILKLLSLLKEKDADHSHMENRLSEATSIEEKSKKHLNKVEEAYIAEIRQLRATLDEAKKVRDELCNIKDKELQDCLSREEDLRKCFKEQITTIEANMDQLQLENANLRHDVDAKEMLLSNLKKDLVIAQQESQNVTCKYTNLSANMKSLVAESKATISSLMKEQESLCTSLDDNKVETRKLKDALNDSEKEKQALATAKSQLHEKIDENTALIEQFERNVRDLEEKLANDNNMFQGSIDRYEAEISSQKEHIDVLLLDQERRSKLLEEKDSDIAKLHEIVKENGVEISKRDEEKKQLQDLHRALVLESEEEKRGFHTRMKTMEERNDILLEDNSSLQTKLKEAETFSDEAKASLLQAQSSLKDHVVRLTTECVALKSSLKSSNDELALIRVAEKAEIEKVEKALVVSNEQKVSLQEELEPLKLRVDDLETTCEDLKTALTIESDEKRLLSEECSVLKETIEELKLFEHECEQLKNCLDSSNVERASLMVEDLSLKAKIEELKATKMERESLVESSNEEKASVMKECLELKRKIAELETLSIECEKLKQSLQSSNEEKLALHVECSSLRQGIAEFGTLNADCEQLRDRLKFSDEKNALLMGKVSKLETLETECRNLQNLLTSVNMEKDSVLEKLEKNVDKLKVVDKAREKLQDHLKSSIEEKASLVEKCSSQKQRIEELEAVCREHDKLQGTLQSSNEEKLALGEECILLKTQVDYLEDLNTECEQLRNSLKRSDEDNVSLMEKVRNLESLQSLCIKLQQSLASVNVERDSVKKECVLLRNKVEELKTAVAERKQSDEENGLLMEKVSKREIEYGNLQNTLTSVHVEKELAKQECLLLKKKVEELQEAEVEHGKRLNVFTEDMIGECSLLAKNVNELEVTKVEQEKLLKMFTNENASVMEERLFLKKKVADLQLAGVIECGRLEDQLKSSAEEKSSLMEKCSSLEKKVEQLGSFEFEFRNLQNHLASVNDEKTKAQEECMSLKINVEELKASKHLEEAQKRQEMLNLQKSLESKESDCRKLEELVSKMKDEIVCLEMKLSEEELISKRLGLQLRSLDAQLNYADQQLRLTSSTTLLNDQINDKSKSSQLCMSTPSLISIDSLLSETNALCNEVQVNPVNVADHRTEDKTLEGQRDAGSNCEARNEHNVKRQMRRRSALYHTKDESDVDEKGSTVGGSFFMVNQFTNEDEEPVWFDGYDWNRLEELKKRNSTCLPHMRSSYPVETQVRSKEELQEIKLRATPSSPTRKRLRDNYSDSKLCTVTFNLPPDKITHGNENCGLPRSKSDERISTRFSERIASKLSIQKKKNIDEQSLLYSTLEQSNGEGNRRQSIAFNVDVTPRKKPRPALRNRRSVGKSDLTLPDTNNSKEKGAKDKNMKKFPLQRKSNMKSDKKPLTSRNNNII